MSNALTLLTHNSLPQTKIWKKDGSIEPSAKGKYFVRESVEVNDLMSLADLLASLEKRNKSVFIRGKYVGDEKANALTDPDRPKGMVARNLDTFEDQPLNVCMIEVDDYSPTLSDPVNEPEDAIAEFIEDSLPDYFHEKSYYYQLSSSAGKKGNIGTLKAHIWFWLKEPLTSAQLKSWAENIALKSDHSVYNPVQLHFTAAPIFEEGIKDPVPKRSGFVSGSGGDEVGFSEEAIAACKANLRTTSHVPLAEQLSKDPVVQRIHELGLYKSTHRNGTVYFQCPFSDGHSQPSSETSTSYLLPHTNGYKYGTIKCFHQSCSKRTTADFYDKLGVVRNIALDAQDHMGVAGWVSDAHYTIDGAVTLMRMGGEWYRYSGRCYKRIDDEAVRSILWGVLHSISRRNKDGVISDFRPKQADVGGVLDALKSVVRRVDIKPNSWTNGENTSDSISMSNGIFNITNRDLTSHSPHFFTLNSLPFDYIESGSPNGFINFLRKMNKQSKRYKRCLVIFSLPTHLSKKCLC